MRTQNERGPGAPSEEETDKRLEEHLQRKGCHGGGKDVKGWRTSLNDAVVHTSRYTLLQQTVRKGANNVRCERKKRGTLCGRQRRQTGSRHWSARGDMSRWLKWEEGAELCDQREDRERDMFSERDSASHTPSQPYLLPDSPPVRTPRPVQCVCPEAQAHHYACTA